jgi:alkylation response protein AidB-like acyl-CoA dehydrogenase
LTRVLSRAGFFRIFLPETYGELDLTPTEGIAVFEELAQADASVAWCVWNGNTHWVITQLAPEAARTIHADTEAVTTNSTRSSGRADAVAGRYHVSGRWSLVSGCELAAWMLLLCVIHEDGKPRNTIAGAPEMRFMVLPGASCEIVDTWTVGGLRGTGSHDVVVHDAFVSDAYSAGFGDPYVLLEPRYRIQPLGRLQIRVAVICGVLQSVLDR